MGLPVAPPSASFASRNAATASWGRPQAKRALAIDLVARLPQEDRRQSETLAERSPPRCLLLLALSPLRTSTSLVIRPWPLPLRHSRNTAS